MQTDIASPDHWPAYLRLRFATQTGKRSILAYNRHSGPLLVQKPLYPEGPQICHVIVLHPPSGIAGGDDLEINVSVENQAHALLTTPGATRWYKANDRKASQRIRLDIEDGAKLDWLPQENLLFEAAFAESETQVNLHGASCAIGWDCYQFGSIAASSPWQKGLLALRTSISLDGRPIWLESGRLDASDPRHRSLSGMAGLPLMANLWSVGPPISEREKEQLAALLPWEEALRCGVSQMMLSNNRSLVLVRLLGLHIEAVRQQLVKCWEFLRPRQLGIAATPLRLWRT